MWSKTLYRSIGLFVVASIVVIIFMQLIFYSWKDRESNNKLMNFDRIKLTIIDGNGSEVTLSKPINRIIVEYTDNAELVRILNKGDKVVGVAGYDYIFKKSKRQFPEFSKLPSVGYPWLLNYEAVMALNPDLLLSFTPNTEEKKKKLPNVPVVFLGLYYPNLIQPEDSKFIRGVVNLGRILDAEDEATKFILWYLEVIEKILRKTREIPISERPKVLISSFPHMPNADLLRRTFTQRDTLTQASLLAGGRNIASDLPGFFSEGYSVDVDLEWLISQNPDIIILHGVDRIDLYGYENDNIEKIRKELSTFLKRPELSSINAVRNRKVYVFYGAFRNDASGGAIAAAYMAKIFNSDFTKDINPEQIHQEYLSRFNRLTYDLNEYGIFVFPPLEDNGNLMGIPNRYKGISFFED